MCVGGGGVKKVGNLNILVVTYAMQSLFTSCTLNCEKKLYTHICMVLQKTQVGTFKGSHLLIKMFN